VLAGVDAMVEAGEVLVRLEPADVGTARHVEQVGATDQIRSDLEEVNTRHAFGLDENRPDAVAKRRKTGQRTARENVSDLVDDGTWVEYGALVIAAQRQRRKKEDLVARTPADGMIAGIGRINGALFDARDTRAVVTSYDYTVLAGTQGTMNHLKKDRMFEIAEQQGLPVVLFSEGGGGRPGDTDHAIVAGLDCRAFQYFAELSGKVPLVGVNSGRCFAGNAALLGCCDVVIATKASNIGMGGPAMIEGGGLGKFAPEEIGPSESQYRNGVIDVLVDDDAEAVAMAKKYLGYFQGDLETWTSVDQTLLRSAVPENRLRVYEVRHVIETLMDEGSVLELRGGFGAGMVTALARIEGTPVGVIANNPKHLGGAIDAEAADKASDFMALCSAFGIPLVFVCDTPGFMVGPEAEETGMVKRAARLFTTGAQLEVPFCTVVLRKGYGLGAQSMAGGSFKAPAFTISWPTGEFGGMGLEGAVKLGFRKELDSIGDPVAREKMFAQMVALAYERGKAINMAEHFEIDAVIDPADTRRWILTGIRSS
ncbi:MAG: carboxyl transferase domain-containing protein, partial [Polyangiales bacterium]